MLEAKIDEEISDFKHFCEGEPIYCYYFRVPAIQKVIETPMVDQEKAPSAIAPETQKKALDVD